jgi:hypothetical protein
VTYVRVLVAGGLGAWEKALVPRHVGEGGDLWIYILVYISSSRQTARTAIRSARGGAAVGVVAVGSGGFSDTEIGRQF